MTRRLLAIGLVAAVTTTILVAALAGCGGGDPADRRLLMVGIDAAEWAVIRPLLEEGRMPNLQRLIDSGVSCGLRSLEPKQKSPVIWTTIATGKNPEKHGISDYIDPTSKKILTSNVRTARTFWDILGEEGKTVTVIGWLVSWPAEAVNGYMVTDYFRFGQKPGRELPEDLTYPEELLTEIEPLRITSDMLTDEEIARFVSPDAALTRDEARELPMDELFVEMRAIDALERTIAPLRDFHAGDRTFLRVAKHLIREHPTDVCIVYLRGVDSVCHKFWAAAHRGEVGIPISHTDARVFGETVDLYYEYADEMLGELVEAYGDGATVIVCSDHGFEGPKPGKKPGGINEHGPVGVLIAAGDGFRSGVEVGEANVRDVTPTILALYGLPVANDMDGEVFEEAFEPGYLARHGARNIPSYERMDRRTE